MAETPQTTTTPATYGSVLWANLVSLAILLWICVRNLSLALEARGRVAALLAMPPWWLYGAGLLLAAAGLVAALLARLRRLPPDRPPYRLLPVLAAIFLGVQIFAVPHFRLPLSVDVLVAAQASLLDPGAFAEEDGLFTTDAARVTAGLGTLDAPFLDRDGEPMGKWRPVVRTGCAGPVTEVPAATEAGAALYCVSADRGQVWLSLVGLEGLAGKPRLVPSEDGGATLHWQQRPAAAPQREGEAAPAPSLPHSDE